MFLIRMKVEFSYPLRTSLEGDVDVRKRCGPNEMAKVGMKVEDWKPTLEDRMVVVDGSRLNPGMGETIVQILVEIIYQMEVKMFN